jgi:hypothetical protein
MKSKNNTEFNREEAILYIVSVFSRLSKNVQEDMLKKIYKECEGNHSCESKNTA